jgi:hypothetical protein
VIQAEEERLGREQDAPRGGELDGERYPAQAMANGRNCGRVCLGEREIRSHRLRPRDEEAHRLSRALIVGWRSTGEVRQSQRRHGNIPLA